MQIYSKYYYFGETFEKPMIESSLEDHFCEKDIFTRNELFQYYQLGDNQLHPSTFAWRIYDLKRKGVIKQIGRGLYTLASKINYSHELNANAEKAASQISKNFKHLVFCISDSTWINEFTLHQYSNNFTIVEVEKDFIESVFFNLRQAFQSVFLKPNIDEFDKYITGLKKAIILIPLITRSPIYRAEGKKYYNPTLEKMLVDIFTHRTPYLYLTNSEIELTIENAFKKYSINQTTILAYAQRRGRRKSIQKFLNKKNLLEVIND